jgi:hypothetical protein
MREALLTHSFCLSLTNAFRVFADFFPNCNFPRIFSICQEAIRVNRWAGWGEGEGGVVLPKSH